MPGGGHGDCIVAALSRCLPETFVAIMKQRAALACLFSDDAVGNATCHSLSHTAQSFGAKL